MRLDEVCEGVPFPTMWAQALDVLRKGKKYAKELPQVLQRAMETQAIVTCEHSPPALANK